MRPELISLIQDDPHRYLDRALRSVAERVGAGYRLSGGAPRRRGGYTPSRDDIRQVLQVVGAEPGFTGIRNTVLVGSGARVNALRKLDGNHCIRLPAGRVRLFLHEKGKREAREVELDQEQANHLQAYIHAFNACAVASGWKARIQLGAPGPIWCEPGGQRWTYARIAATLRISCSQAGVPPLTPHALRRAFASDVASGLPRYIVGLAGGWQGIERLDNHYIQVRERSLWAKLDRANQRHPSDEQIEERIDAPALAV
jgi:integrase